MEPVKPLAILTGVVLIASITLAALGYVTWRLFWMVAIAAALVAYYVIPHLQKRTNG
jgi:hypothetical protein